MEYGIQYEDHLVRDATWRCIADVVATYHGSPYTDDDHRVTGTLVSRANDNDAWIAVEAT